VPPWLPHPHPATSTASASVEPRRVTDLPRLRLALRPRDALRLALPGSQTRLAARVAEPSRPPLGSHYHTAASSRDRRYQGASGKVIGRIAGSVTPASR